MAQAASTLTRRSILSAIPAVAVVPAIALAAPASSDIRELFWKWWETMRRHDPDRDETEEQIDLRIDQGAELERKILMLKAATAEELAMQYIAATGCGDWEASPEVERDIFYAIIPTLVEKEQQVAQALAARAAEYAAKHTT